MMEKVRLMSERMDRLEGFIVYSAIGGSLGSFGMSRLSVDYKNKDILNVALFPDKIYNANATPIEPYNFAMAFHDLIQYSSSMIAFTNHQLNQAA